MDSDQLIVSSPLAWVTLNHIQTENQKEVEFKDHRFLIDLYADMHHDIAVRKSAQVGESVERILKAIWCARYLKVNIIYVLPTNNVVRDFVAPKVNPIITSNKAIQALVSKDSESLKQIGDRFIYFKGAFSERDAIAISGDILILDELDRMPDMSVVNTYDSRLQASSFGWRWRLSNPSQVGYGIDQLYTESDQRHWFVRCSHCGYRSWLDFEKADHNNHYVDVEASVYACGMCNKELTDDDRRYGEWVAKYPTRKRHGYWISQLMAPWVSAERILEQKNESSIDFFYNFVLGKAYTPSDLIVNRETILRACAPSSIAKNDVVIGVDQNISEQIWVAATPEGVFAHGRTQSWEDFEHLMLMWNAIVVADPMPYQPKPKQLAEKYSGRFFMCRFKQMDGLKVVEFKGSTVYADRTRLLDTVAEEIATARLMFREAPHQLEDYIADWQNLYRTTVEKPNGQSKSEWLKKENKESDYSLATAYMRIGLSRILGSGIGMSFAEPKSGIVTPKADYVTQDGRLVTGSMQIDEAYNRQEEKGWKYL